MDEADRYSPASPDPLSDTSGSVSSYPFGVGEFTGMIEEEAVCSSGWKQLFRYPYNYKDVTEEGVLSLSSCSPGYGVKELLHESPDKCWKTNRALPHQVIVEFQKKTEVSYLLIYLDYHRDESYCPSSLKIELGWATNQIWFKKQKLLHKPQGWVKIELLDKERKLPSRAMVLILTVEGNHEGGRDCNIRHFRIVGPSRSIYDPLVQMNSTNIGGTGAILPEFYFNGKPNLNDAIVNVYKSLR